MRESLTKFERLPFESDPTNKLEESNNVSNPDLRVDAMAVTNMVPTTITSLASTTTTLYSTAAIAGNRQHVLHLSVAGAQRAQEAGGDDGRHHQDDARDLLLRWRT